MAEYETVAKTSDLEPGDSMVVDIEDEQIALFNLDGEIHAINNRCPHEGGDLGQGMVNGDTVRCPIHGAPFNIPSGDVLGPPAQDPVSCYDVRLDNGDIQVKL